MATTSTQQTIETKLNEALTPVHLEVLNESYMHAVPANSETHFKVIVISSLFENENRVQRHQIINRLLAEELAGCVHALSMQTHTPEEWILREEKIIASPQCQGAKKDTKTSAH